MKNGLVKNSQVSDNENKIFLLLEIATNIKSNFLQFIENCFEENIKLYREQQRTQTKMMNKNSNALCNVKGKKCLTEPEDFKQQSTNFSCKHSNEENQYTSIKKITIYRQNNIKRKSISKNIIKQQLNCANQFNIAPKNNLPSQNISDDQFDYEIRLESRNQFQLYQAKENICQTSLNKVQDLHSDQPKQTVQSQNNYHQHIQSQNNYHQQKIKFVRLQKIQSKKLHCSKNIKKYTSCQIIQNKKELKNTKEDCKSKKQKQFLKQENKKNIKKQTGFLKKKHVKEQSPKKKDGKKKTKKNVLLSSLSERGIAKKCLLKNVNQKCLRFSLIQKSQDNYQTFSNFSNIKQKSLSQIKKILTYNYENDLFSSFLPLYDLQENAKSLFKLFNIISQEPLQISQNEEALLFSWPKIQYKIIWSSKQKILYLGEIKQNKETKYIKHGFGIEYSECFTYVGQFYNGTHHGNGEQESKEFLYKGKFVKGAREGSGKYLSYIDGSKYEGEFKNNLRHGNGVLLFKSGTEYKGEFKLDKRHGKGIEKTKDGFIYDCQFFKNKKHGFGIIYTKQGEKQQGFFGNDKFSLSQVSAMLPQESQLHMKQSQKKSERVDKMWSNIQYQMHLRKLKNAKRQ